MNIDVQYKELINKIITTGKWKENRTGIPTMTIPAAVITHDMSEGFPLITTKKVYYHAVKVELEGFIKGITDKTWYQSRKCRIWNEWCNPELVKDLKGDEKKLAQLNETDLGPIYGSQWRNFNGENKAGSDQLTEILNLLKTDPNSRRMVCSAWNPNQLHMQALPPCHVLWEVCVIGDTLNFTWYQRSTDVALGLPFDLASYATLMHLLCRWSGFKPGILTGFLNDVHLYENTIEGVKQQIDRTPFELPQIETVGSLDPREWTHDMTTILNYNSHEAIKMTVAV